MAENIAARHDRERSVDRARPFTIDRIEVRLAMQTLIE